MDTARPGQSDGSDELLEAMPDAIVIVGLDGRVVRVNQRAVTVSGYSAGELVGMTVEDLLPSALRSAHVGHRTAYQRAPTVRSMGGHLDIRFRRKDGSEFPADIALSPLATERGILTVAAVRDITERRQAEEELLRAQESFRLVVEGVRDHAIFLLGSDGVVRSWSPAATAMLGCQAVEVIGRHFSTVFAEADRVLNSAVDAGHGDEEVQRIGADGSPFWASVTVSPIRDVAGKQLGFAVIIRDVTEQRRQDDRLRAVLEVARATLEGRSQEELLGLVAARARALVGHGAAAVELADSDAAAELADSDAPAGPADPLDGLGGRPAPDLGQRSLRVRMAAGPRLIGHLAVAAEQDGEPFTADDQRLLELYAAQAAVAVDYARAQGDLRRLAVLDDRERIGRELHDGAIQALFAVGMSLQGMAISTADSALRERLEGTVGRIDDVIRDLRNYIFGLRPGLAADRGLGLALQHLATELEEQHGVVCALEVDPEVAARLAGRAGDIVQMVREALSNVGRHAGAATCRLSLQAEPGLAVLVVEDDGHGFAAPGGGGLGLRNLRERAAAMGGSLEVASVPGEGTTVTLRVPA